MQMDAGLDTGAILHVASCPIEPRETGGSLHDKLAELGARELATALPDLLAARLPGRPQGNACSSYAHRLDKSEAAIDWTLPASTIERNVRAFNPWPVAYCDIQVDRGYLWRWYGTGCTIKLCTCIGASLGTKTR